MSPWLIAANLLLKSSIQNAIRLKVENFKSTEEIQIEIYSKMSFTRKWEEVCRLRETAWKLKAAGIRMQHPNWDDREVQAEVRKIFLYATT
jgi:hypothetical protein